MKKHWVNPNCQNSEPTKRTVSISANESSNCVCLVFLSVSDVFKELIYQCPKTVHAVWRCPEKFSVWALSSSSVPWVQSFYKTDWLTDAACEFWNKLRQLPSQSAPTILVLKTWDGLSPWKRRMSELYISSLLRLGNVGGQAPSQSAPTILVY